MFLTENIQTCNIAYFITGWGLRAQGLSPAISCIQQNVLFAKQSIHFLLWDVKYTK